MSAVRNVKALVNALILESDLTGCSVLWRMGGRWKERRRLFQHHFHLLDTSSHQPIELEYTHKMLRRLADTPDKFMEHLRQ